MFVVQSYPVAIVNTEMSNCLLQLDQALPQQLTYMGQEQCQLPMTMDMTGFGDELPVTGEDVFLNSGPLIADDKQLAIADWESDMVSL